MADIKTTYNIELDEYVLDPPQKEDLDQLLKVCRESLEDVNEEMISQAFKLCYFISQGYRKSFR